MPILANLKLWGIAFLGAILTVLTAGVITLKAQRDKARRDREIAVASIHVERTKRKIIKEKKKELSLKESEIKERLKEYKEKPDEDINLDDLFDNSDW